MRFADRVSIITVIPLFFILLLGLLFVKNYFFDLRDALDYEKEKYQRDLPLLASMLQSNFSHYLSDNDTADIQKELTLLQIDRAHYSSALILDSDLRPLYAYDKSYLTSLPEVIHQELISHDISSLMKTKEIFIHYDDAPGHRDGDHFDVAIPLDKSSAPERSLRSFKGPILYFHYSIAQELDAIKRHYKKNIAINFVFILTLLISLLLLGYLFVLKKIRALAELTQRFSQKNYGLRSNIRGMYEISTLSNAFNLMAQTIEDDFKTIKVQNHTMLKFQRIVEQSPVMVLITDPTNVIEYANPILLMTYGYKEEELLGQTPRLFKSGVQPTSFYEVLWGDVLSRGIWKGQIINNTKDKKRIIEEQQIFPIKNEEGETTNYVAIKSDITRAIELQKASSFQAKLAQMGEMISMIAHQWRQPLSSINAIAANCRIGIMLDKIDSEKFLKDLQDIETITTYLSSTIQDFRNFFKSDNKKSLTSFKTIVDKSFALIQHTLTQLNVHYEIAVDETPFENFEGELMQVVLNLLKNSADIFQDKRIGVPQIRISTVLTQESITLLYQDNAGGTSVEPIEMIFEPYFTTKDELQGTGIGLYMSKTIIEEHCQGRLDVRNIPDGIEFTIRLPR